MVLTVSGTMKGIAIGVIANKWKKYVKTITKSVTIIIFLRVKFVVNRLVKIVAICVNNVQKKFVELVEVHVLVVMIGIATPTSLKLQIGNFVHYVQIVMKK